MQKKCVRKKVVPKHPTGVSELQIKILFPLNMASNDDDRRQWRKQGGVVGFKGRCNAAASFLSHLPHSVLDSKHFCERLPRHIDKAVRSCYVSIDKSVPYGALYTLFHHAVAAAERIKP